MEHPEPTQQQTKGRPRRLLRIVGSVVAAFVVGSLVVWYLVVPYPWTLRTRSPDQTALMQQRVAEQSPDETALVISQDWIPLAQVSPNLVRAVLVAEDYRFRQHRGVDWVSLAEEVQWTGDAAFSWWSLADVRALGTAVDYAWRNRDDIRGRSTITQQLAKNLYFGTDRSFARKAMEFVVAGRLERRLGKDRILELYLNVVEWGPGVFGAEAAARTYFGRSAADLTLRQAASLAATLPHPLTSNPAYQPGRMAWRRDLILARLDPGNGIPDPPAPIPAPELWIDLQPDFEVDVELPPLLNSDPTGM